MIITDKGHALRRYLFIKDNLGPQSITQLKLKASLWPITNSDNYYLFLASEKNSGSNFD